MPLLLLSRKQIRLLLYFAVVFILCISVKLIFNWTDRGIPLRDSSEPDPPELVVQRGNDHYFEPNTLVNISSALQREGNKWSLPKRDVNRNGDKFGKLNFHIWDEICGEDLESLRNHVLFPRLPSRRRYATTTGFPHSKDNTNFGGRIFGFLHPSKSGRYNFLVRGSPLEVWISSSKDPRASKLVLKQKYFRKSSEGVRGTFAQLMTAGSKYYIEILYKKGHQDYGFDLRWKPPGSSHYFELRGNDISLMIYDKHLAKGQIDSDEPVEEIQGVHKKNPFPVYDDFERARANLYQLPMLTDEIIENILPTCEYKPSYLADGVVENYNGVWETHYNSLYPLDKSNITRQGWISLGNDELDEAKAIGIVKKYMERIDMATKRKYILKRVLSVEENHDNIKGDRYLLELELQEVKNGKMKMKSYRLSKYVYKPKDSDWLCYPKGYHWKRNATVNIVLTVGGHQGRWVQHFINNIAEIYRETKDKNLNVVIMDFHSNDIDIKAALKKSGLPRYILLRMNSRFHKTFGLQYAMKLITDPNDIVFVCDLHLVLPVTIVDHIRKHCIQGKTAFSPLLVRLDCGKTPDNPHGRWESDGYGPMATFKSDWDRFGGMNVEKFRHSWGGEDWEMVDRILTAGYEIERLKIMNFFHFYHTKKGMWDEAK